MKQHVLILGYGEIGHAMEYLLAQNSLCLSIAKGLDETGRTAAQVFEHVFNSKHHYGVVYSPMIAEELRAGRQLVRGEWANISGEGVHTLRMVEKYRPFDWRGFPLFTLAHDIVTAPQTLHERVDDYLRHLREVESCSI